MISVALRNSPKDAELIEREIRDETAYTTDEFVKAKRLDNIEMIRKAIKQHEELDIICVDVTDSHGIQNAELLRSGYPAAAMMIVADVNTPPTQYMRPSIMAAALSLKPLEASKVRNAVRQIFETFICSNNSNDNFVVDNRSEMYRIPYSGIMYFEARMKKIYVCTKNNEYGFYDTLDALAFRLPKEFIRCHRGYVVNRKYISKIMVSKGIVLLEDNIEIPLSRSYKHIFKEL